MDTQPLNGEIISDDRKKYYGKLRGHSCAPLWEHLAQLVTREPVITAIPHIWDYSKIREDLLHSAHVISAEEAERRRGEEGREEAKGIHGVHHPLGVLRHR